jgi:hypothetical protein
MAIPSQKLYNAKSVCASTRIVVLSGHRTIRKAKATPTISSVLIGAIFFCIHNRIWYNNITETEAAIAFIPSLTMIFDGNSQFGGGLPSAVPGATARAGFRYADGHGKQIAR